ncbi:MAG TPA: hypothetical protein VJ946_03970, partial [Bacteroidales bacterium]|nr:hypothetical protein [Bacteroidales bacterium]
EINKMKRGEIDDHYVEEFKKAYAKKRSEDLKDNFSWMNMLSMYDENGMYNYSPEMDALVEKISKADIRNFAGRIFNDDVKMDVTFLPEKAK